MKLTLITTDQSLQINFQETFWAHTEHRQLPETISRFTLFITLNIQDSAESQSSSGGNSKQADVSVSTTVVNVDAETRGFKKNPVYKSFKSQSL